MTPLPIITLLEEFSETLQHLCEQCQASASTAPPTPPDDEQKEGVSFTVVSATERKLIDLGQERCLYLPLTRAEGQALGVTYRTPALRIVAR
jgi:hypothetical protein